MNIEELYERIACEHNVSVEEVKMEIQNAITQAWTDPARTEEIKRMQSKVQMSGDAPTVEEFILYIQSRIMGEL